MSQRYRVKGDGDGHYWLVPVGREGEFEAWLEKADYGEPSWLKRIDGPHRLTFADPHEE